MMKIILQSIRLFFLILSVFFGYLSISRFQLTYINGKYFDEKSSVIYSEDALLAYYILAILSITMVILISVFLKNKK